MSERRLNELAVGQKASVVKVEGDPSFKRRLQEMGMLRGTPVEIIRLAPFGDPLEIKLRGYHLSLRQQEAALVLVQLPD